MHLLYLYCTKNANSSGQEDLSAGASAVSYLCRLGNTTFLVEQVEITLQVKK